MAALSSPTNRSLLEARSPESRLGSNQQSKSNGALRRVPRPRSDARQTAGIELFEAPALSDANY
jgi:hypothetical protein